MQENIKCNYCFGCNLLEIRSFTGKTECKNFVQAKDSGLDVCKKIIEGIQMKL